MFKLKTNKTSGITLVALVVTIIVLLILTGVSIMTITGNNGILTRAGEAKDQTEIAREKEILKQSTLVAMDKSKFGNVEKLYVDAELESYSEVEDTEEIDEGIQVTFKSGRAYLINTDGDVEEIVTADRTGISVGDYITYTSPTASVTFTDADTGYYNYASTPATLEAKTLFRVMDIDKYGNMTLIGAMTSSDPKITFYGYKAYNNAVYTLNKKCSDLYKDKSRRISARSIKVEDITDKMIEGTKGDTTAESTGRKKLEKYQDEKVAELSTTYYLIAKDTTKNTITYRQNTHYPDIFQYEVGGLIDNIPTTGEVGQSESYIGYGGLTTLKNKTPIPTNLTVPYTYYNVKPTENDFDNTNGNALAYKNIFFEPSAEYWLASRCIDCVEQAARFYVRKVYIGGILGSYFGNSSGWDSASLWGGVCPVVYIPSSVEVEISPSTDTSEYHKTVPHVVK